MRAHRRPWQWGSLVLVLAGWGASIGHAHPLLVSYVDVRIAAAACDVDVTSHAQDLATEIGLQGEPDVLAADFVARFGGRVSSLVLQRLSIEADGVPLSGTVEGVEVNPSQRSVRTHLRFPCAPALRELRVRPRLFPSEPTHQTFVNIYVENRLRFQDTLSGLRFEGIYHLDAGQGRVEVFRRFVASGIEHIAIGPDHILFLIGLLVTGGGAWQIVRIVTAFTVAHSVTLSLAVLGVVTPPARVVEPAIALSICVVGLDALLRRPAARDRRMWIAFCFGLVHGFGFASVLAETGLPRRAMGLALFAFNVGVEIGQLAIVATVLALMVWLWRRWPASRAVATRAISLLVVAAGCYWLVERLFFV